MREFKLVITNTIVKEVVELVRLLYVYRGGRAARRPRRRRRQFVGADAIVAVYLFCCNFLWLKKVIRKCWG